MSSKKKTWPPNLFTWKRNIESAFPLVNFLHRTILILVSLSHALWISCLYLDWLYLHSARTVQACLKSAVARLIHFIRIQPPSSLAFNIKRLPPPRNWSSIHSRSKNWCASIAAALIHFCVCSVCSLGARSSRQIYVVSLLDFPPSFRRSSCLLSSLSALPSHIVLLLLWVYETRERTAAPLSLPSLLCVVSLVDYNYVGCGSIGFAFHPKARPMTSATSSPSFHF